MRMTLDGEWQLSFTHPKDGRRVLLTAPVPGNVEQALEAGGLLADCMPADTDSAEAEALKTPPAYAGYRVDKENPFSRITVIAYAKNGVLVSVKILSEGEEGKDLLTDEIKAEWAKAILESQSAAPDAISGATLTYSAASVQEAMAEILEKAAGR